MRICYCEDEAAQAELFQRKIEAWAEKNQVAVQIDLYESAEEFLFKTQAFSYDVLFLDIAMKTMNGMELARKIRDKDKDSLLVFVTSDASFVFEGYEVNAYRYLMKPLDENKLYEILEYAATRQCRENHSILLKIEKEYQSIRIGDISYIEVQGHYVKLHFLEGETVTVKAGFTDILKKINEKTNDFIRTHRSYAVNLASITKIGRTECYLVTGEMLPVSKSAYQSLNQAFIRFHLER